MPMVTVFRGLKFDGAEEIDDFDFPSVPRIGESVSLSDGAASKFDKVTDVNYHADKNGIMIRILLPSTASRDMQAAKVGGF